MNHKEMVMSTAVETPEFDVKLPEAQVDPYRREQWAFYCKLGELLKSHPGQHAAFYGRQVVELGPDRMEVIRRVRERFGNVPIYVGHISDEPPPLERVPGYRASR
jgi:Family of unknown function (DUF5678)